MKVEVKIERLAVQAVVRGKGAEIAKDLIEGRVEGEDLHCTGLGCHIIGGVLEELIFGKVPEVLSESVDGEKCRNQSVLQHLGCLVAIYYYINSSGLLDYSP